MNLLCAQRRGINVLFVHCIAPWETLLRSRCLAGISVHCKPTQCINIPSYLCMKIKQSLYRKKKKTMNQTPGCLICISPYLPPFLRGDFCLKVCVKSYFAKQFCKFVGICPLPHMTFLAEKLL